MTTHKIFTESELLENVERLEDIWPCMERLRHLAHYELYNLNKQNDEFFALCIYGDSPCRDLVHLMFPDEDYDEIRAQGFEPILYGIVSWNFFELISDSVPDLTASLADKPHEGMVRFIFLHQKSGSVFDIRPEPETGLH